MDEVLKIALEREMVALPLDGRNSTSSICRGMDYARVPKEITYFSGSSSSNNTC
jgi:hypothetical protein